MAESAAPKKPRCRICPWLWGLGLVAAVGIVVWVTQYPPATNPQQQAFQPRGMAGMTTPVRVASAAPARIPYVIEAIGTVTAFNTVTVRSRVDGELQAVLFEDGQSVTQGTLLARIDPRTYQVQLDEALGRQKQNAAQLENARRDLQRYQRLFEQNSIARQVLDAQAAQVQQLRGTQQSDQAAVDRARLQLEYTRITAPISGRLGLRRVDQGNLVSGTDVLVTIAQTQPIAVLFTVPQAVLPDVLAQTGQNLMVEVYDRENTRKLATGTLMALENEIDTATGTLRLKARFDNTDQTLFPNQFVNVRLLVNTWDAAVAIPVAAAQYGSVGEFVYLVQDDNTVQMRPVVLGRSDGVQIAVTSGLNAGDRVVIEGTDRLRDGVRVSPHEDAMDAASKPAAAPPDGDPRPNARRDPGMAAPGMQAPRRSPQGPNAQPPSTPQTPRLRDHAS